MALFLYRSSAGSGKTYTLVKEYLKIVLTQPERFKNILAITFTNKAAGEMKERILDALVKLVNREDPDLKSVLVRELPADVDIRERSAEVLNKLLHHYSDFSVSTIDSFMFRVINSFALELGIPINCRVDLNHQEIYTYVVDGIMAQIGLDQGLTQLILKFVYNKVRQNRSWNIEEDIKNFEAQIFNEKNFEWIKKASEIQFPELSEYISELNTRVSRFLKELNAQGARGLKMVVDAGLPVKGSSPAKFLEKISGIGNDVFGSGFSIYKKFTENKWYADSAPNEEKLKFEELLAAGLATIREQVVALFEEPFTGAYTARLILSNIYLLAIINQIKGLVEKYKEEFNILPISDFNLKVNDIVQNSPVPFIYTVLGERYHHYLIDEFQDTNRLQWQNLLPLIEDSLGYNAFNMVVGDGKQSIYRFRGGDVEIMEKEIQSQFSDQQLKVKRLMVNYRSLDNIVKFNNKFFSGVIEILAPSHPNLKGVYDEIQQQPADSPGGLVSLDLLPEEEGKNKSRVQQRVKEIVDQNLASGFKLSDICVLVRKRSEGEEVAQYLIDNGMAVISSDSLHITHSPVVQFIINALKYLLNPGNKIVEISLVYFPVLFPVYPAVNIKDLENYFFTNDIKYLWPQLGEFIRRKDYLIRMPIYELIEELVRIFSLSSLTGGQQTSYVQAFLDRVNLYAQDNSDDLSSFLDWWEYNSRDFFLELTEQKEAVKILTIHKAKGLEFPVVILPFPDWQFSEDKKQWLCLEGEISENPISQIPLLVNRDRRLAESLFKNAYLQERDKVILDNINLFYVACTRASERLYLIGQNDGSESIPHDRMNNWFLTHIAKPLMQEEKGENRFVLGQSDSPSEKERVARGVYREIKILVSHQWYDRLTVRREAKDFWKFTDAARSRKVQWGNLLHKILAEIVTTDDVDPVLEKFVNSGEISRSDYPRVQDELKQMFAREDVKRWFNPQNRAFSEFTILTKEGDKRPDRVILTEDGIWVVDFKSGDEQEKHYQQVGEYMQLIEGMGHDRVRGFLFYLSTMKTKEVTKQNG